MVNLKTVTGLAQSVASLSRAIGPALATSIFAFSIDRNILSGRLVWLILIIISSINFGTSYLLHDEGAVWRNETKNSTEEESVEDST